MNKNKQEILIMAKKLSPQLLREKAKFYAQKAKEEENKRYIQVGRLVEKELLSKNFNPANLQAFKQKVSGILLH